MERLLALNRSLNRIASCSNKQSYSRSETTLLKSTREVTLEHGSNAMGTAFFS